MCPSPEGLACRSLNTVCKSKGDRDPAILRCALDPHGWRPLIRLRPQHYLFVRLTRRSPCVKAEGPEVCGPACSPYHRGCGFQVRTLAASHSLPITTGHSLGSAN